ncbi:MAG: 1-acyl-sn-glycerol-3-phosphate acyltransferase [Candidatus Obscuribacterales bacterium]|nr:1-acyl-sn-glycerol-3-phosphate acyltransferase [Candidatus Obscuribacterales bacterium]
MSFSESYKSYIKAARKATQFGSNLKTMAQLEPFLGWLFKHWWHVDMQGIERLPHEGPALIIGNTAGIIPWPGLMLAYALMCQKTFPRRVNILCELGWIEDERIHHLARELGFVPWSADNAKKLFAQGELVAVFPEGIQGAVKPFAERYRLREFDWTRILPALEENVKIFPMATLGCDESFPIIANLEGLARVLEIPAFPVTPFMPLLPFPFNMASLPGHWKMRIQRPLEYQKVETRNERYETALSLSKELEGEVQAELNRLLRMRIKAL